MYHARKAHIQWRVGDELEPCTGSAHCSCDLNPHRFNGVLENALVLARDQLRLTKAYANDPFHPYKEFHKQTGRQWLL